MSLHSRSSRAQKQPLQGFTLMEMMIVIAIMLLLVIATLPRIKQALEDSKVRESSRQLNSYFALAKARAASTGRPCGLWFITERLGDPNANPGVFQTTQLYLAEIPPSYSGDFLESKVVVTDSSGSNLATLNNGPNWLLNFVSIPGSLMTLVNPGDNFGIRFDHKGPTYVGQRDINSGQFYIISAFTNLSPYIPTVPPTANGLYDATNNPYAGYSFEIIRNPQRIGAPLNLPRGTAVDLGYSGFGNAGTDFYSSVNQVVVLFTPEGRVGNVTYQTYDVNNNNYPLITNDAQGTIHFLLGRPEKVGRPLLQSPSQSNIEDNNALWVSVGRLTGSVTTTENAPNVNFVFSSPPTAAEQQAYLTIAREFAITQDVKGGQ